MDWEQICTLCQTELEALEAKVPPLTDFFPSPQDTAQALSRYEKETSTAVEFAVREFAGTSEWPSLTPIQKVMLSFRLDFAASMASLLAQQPAPWTDADRPNQRAQRLCWLMLFAWENEGYPKLQKMLGRLAGKDK
jgi:hypothetical protein